MSAVMNYDAKTTSAVIADTDAQPREAASFGTALLGFMITTTLTTSIMVLLSQG